MQPELGSRVRVDLDQSEDEPKGCKTGSGNFLELLHSRHTRATTRIAEGLNRLDGAILVDPKNKN